MRGEDIVRQLTDTRGEPVLCISSGACQYQKSLYSGRTRAGTEVNRCATGAEAVAHQLRTSTAVELSPVPLSLTACCRFAYPSWKYFPHDVCARVDEVIVYSHRASSWEFLDRGTPCDWTPRLMVLAVSCVSEILGKEKIQSPHHRHIYTLDNLPRCIRCSY